MMETTKGADVDHPRNWTTFRLAVRNLLSKRQVPYIHDLDERDEWARYVSQEVEEKANRLFSPTSAPPEEADSEERIAGWAKEWEDGCGYDVSVIDGVPAPDERPATLIIHERATPAGSGEGEDDDVEVVELRLSEEECAILDTARRVLDDALRTHGQVAAFDLDPIGQRKLPAALRCLHAVLPIAERLRMPAAEMDVEEAPSALHEYAAAYSAYHRSEGGQAETDHLNETEARLISRLSEDHYAKGYQDAYDDFAEDAFRYREARRGEGDGLEALARLFHAAWKAGHDNQVREGGERMAADFDDCVQDYFYELAAKARTHLGASVQTEGEDDDGR